ncbi:MAG: cell division protein FtsA [Prevotellaceae bacterium]|jgi:cell division protein FtsA|nr:cell division protein FtsA [Prevotellaceae bacterium]
MSRVIAIDLGSTKIVGIAGEKIDDNLYRVIAYGEAPSEGIEHGYVVAPGKVAAVVETILKKIKAEQGIADVKDVFVNIMGKSVKYQKYTTSIMHENSSELISVNEIGKLEKDAYNMHMQAGEEVRHVVPQDYIIDDESNIDDPIGRLGHKISGNFLVIVGDMESAKRIKMCTNKLSLNLSVRKFIFEPVAIARAVLSEEEKKVGVALIDIGGGTTKLLVYKNGVLQHVTVYGLGGDSVTKDIAKVFGLLPERAEEIKLKCSCMPKNIPDNKEVKIKGINGREDYYIPLLKVSEVIRARINEIMDTILQDVKLKSLSAGLVLTGGASQMIDLCEFMREKTGLYIKTGKSECISDDSPAKDEISHRKYATATGLLIYGTDYLEYLEENEEEESAVDNHDNDSGDHKDIKVPWWKEILKIIKNFFTQQQEVE